MRTLLAVVILSLLVAQLLAADPIVRLPKMKQVSFEGWGFSVQVPSDSEKHTLTGQPDAELSELYLSGDLIYFVKVTRTPANNLTSTAIEQAIQADTKSGSKLGPVKRREKDSKDFELFKCLSSAICPSENDPEAQYIAKTLKGKTAYRSVWMAPLGNESSPILSLGVIGPKGREAEIENLANFLAFKAAKAKNKTAAQPAVKPPVSPTPAAPAKSKPTIPSPPKKQPLLKKGDIELVGVVESLDTSARSIELIVDQVMMPGASPIKLAPPRHKTIYYTSLPPELVTNARIRIVGKNTGVGKSMTADVVEVVSK